MAMFPRPHISTVNAMAKTLLLGVTVGILAPRGVPRSVVDKLNAEFGKAVRSPEVQNVYSKVGALPVTNTPEEFAAHVQSEMVKLGKLVQLSGARVD